MYVCVGVGERVRVYEHVHLDGNFLNMNQFFNIL
jgi:hypothetical protein